MYVNKCYRCGEPGAYKSVYVTHFGYTTKALYCFRCWHASMNFPPNHPLKNDS